jgi:hypothetical protein
VTSQRTRWKSTSEGRLRVAAGGGRVNSEQLSSAAGRRTAGAEGVKERVSVENKHETKTDVRKGCNLISLRATREGLLQVLKTIELS